MDTLAKLILTQLVADFDWKTGSEIIKATGLNKSTFNRRVARLLDEKLIAKTSDSYAITQRGTDLLLGVPA
ncbi:MAG: winged helix-turn-helix domain-containing protein [Rhodospirillaceae bacterium]